MTARKLRIGVVAPASRLEPAHAEQVRALAATLYPSAPPELYFHPQCFLSSGHFAGSDAERSRAFLEIANDPAFDVLWFGRGGYGSCRLAESVLPHLNAAAAKKMYLGYSDAGTLLGGLYAKGFSSVAHGPMPADIKRPGGAEAVTRALRYLVERAPDTLEANVERGAKTAAFNVTILSQLLGTPWQPDLSGHELMLEDIGEYMYRLDRSLFHITSNPNIRKVAGIWLGRCTEIPENDPDFGADEVEVVKHWCAVARIPYRGRADIGHDVANKIVPFGAPPVA
jgi:muramoyltetrapeptide carboxypeptidase